MTRTLLLVHTTDSANAAGQVVGRLLALALLALLVVGVILLITRRRRGRR